VRSSGGPSSVPLFCRLLLPSAQRFFMASAIRFRPSGLSRRFVAFLARDAAFAFLLPLGLPRPGAATVVSLNNAFACCSFAISASICATTSAMANFYPPYS
jgi:hypothetical protein